MSPVLFRIGGVPLTAFGCAASLGTLLSFLALHRRAGREGMDREAVVDLLLLILVLGFLGGRVMFVVTYPEAVSGGAWAFLEVWSGGLTWYGGFLGGFLAVWGYSRYRGIPLFDALDFLMPFTAVGHMFGRLGCFGNGCCYGVPTGADWGWVFRFTDPLQVPRHATQLYEAFGLGLIALVLNRLWIHGYRGGRVTAVYMALYALLRIPIEVFRGDTLTESYLLGTSLAQSTAMVMLVAAALMWRFSLPLPRPPLGEFAPDPARVAAVGEDAGGKSASGEGLATGEGPSADEATDTDPDETRGG